MRELGVKVVVSELDIDVIPRGRWWADGGKHREELAKLDPYRDGCPPEILQRQAEQYAQLFRLFRKHAGRHRARLLLEPARRPELAERFPLEAGESSRCSSTAKASRSRPLMP